MQIHKRYYFIYREGILSQALKIAKKTTKTWELYVDAKSTIYESDSLDEIRIEAERLGFCFLGRIKKIEDKWESNDKRRLRILKQTDIVVSTPDFADPTLLTLEERNVVIEMRKKLRMMKSDYADPFDRKIRILCNYDSWGLNKEIVSIIKKLS